MLLIRNGTVVNASGQSEANVLIDSGRISEVQKGISAPGADVIDASGCYVFPGFIDTHTHFDLDTGSAVTADDFITGSRAALLGGTTCVLDFASQDRDKSLQQALDAWHEKARGSSCNYGFHMAAARFDEGVIAELPSMVEQGVTSFKLYMVYTGLRLDDGDIYSMLRAGRAHGLLMGVHCENWEVLQRRTAELKAAGVTGPEGHPASRPAAVEAEAVERLMRIAELAEAPVYVVHLSTGEGLKAALRARERGQEVYLETCPQYLLLDESCYSRPDGAKFVMSPPLRDPSDREALWDALSGGHIDFIGTDHCSFTMRQKAMGEHDFSLIPNGGAGVQHRAQLLYTYGVSRGRLTLERFVELLSSTPARLFGMRRHGAIAPAMAADIVVWDPSRKGIITDTNHAYNSDNTPFAGLSTVGFARHVILNGEHTVKDGELVKPGTGRYIARQPYTPAQRRSGRQTTSEREG